MNKIIKIRYSHDETGHAELLAERLARITNVPLFTDNVILDDIVRLDHDSGDPNGYPRIKEVVFTRFPARTYLSFDTTEEAMTLRAILMILGAECYVILPPRQGKQGVMLVSHEKHLDPVSLANAIGIEQTAEEFDEPASPDSEHSRESVGPDLNDAEVEPAGVSQPFAAPVETASKEWVNRRIHDICRQEGWNSVRAATAAFLHFVESAANRTSLLERLDEVERSGLFKDPSEQ